MSDSDYATRLLKIWDLEEFSLDAQTIIDSRLVEAQLASGSHSNINRPKTIDSSFIDPVPSPVPSNQYCKNCKSLNHIEANWCTECGTAFVSKLASEETIVAAQSIPKHECGTVSEEHVDIYKCGTYLNEDFMSEYNEGTDGVLPDVFHLSSNATLSMPFSNGDENVASNGGLTQNSEDITCNTTFHSYSSDHVALKQIESYKFIPQNKTSKLSQDEKQVQLYDRKKTLDRHWETSKSYTWRKPSSLKLSFNDVNSQQTCRPIIVQPDAHVANQFSKLDSISHIPPLNIKELNLSDENITASFHDGMEDNYYAIPYFLHCPNELLHNILSYLKPVDLYNCMLTCRRLYKIAADKSLWKIIEFKRCKPTDLLKASLKEPVCIKFQNCKCKLNSKMISDFFKALGNCLKILVIILCDFGPHMADVMLSSAATHCINLQNIQCDWTLVSEYALLSTFKLCSRLEVVCVDQHSELSLKTLQMLFYQHSKWIQKVDVGSSLAEDVLTACSEQAFQMKSFGATFETIDRIKICNIIQVFPNLSDLKVYNVKSSIVDNLAIKEISQIPLKSLLLKLHGMNFLDISDCDYISKMITLRHLCVDCINDALLHILCCGALRLDSLDLSGSSISDKSFHHISLSSFQTTLKCLKVNNCEEINKSNTQKTIVKFTHDWTGNSTTQEIEHLIASCQRLRILELIGIHCAQELNPTKYKPCNIIFLHQLYKT